MIYTVSVTLETGSIKGSFLGIVNIWTHVSTLRANQTFNHGLTKFMGIDFLQIWKINARKSWNFVVSLRFSENSSIFFC